MRARLLAVVDGLLAPMALMAWAVVEAQEPPLAVLSTLGALHYEQVPGALLILVLAPARRTTPRRIEYG